MPAIFLYRLFCDLPSFSRVIGAAPVKCAIYFTLDSGCSHHPMVANQIGSPDPRRIGITISERLDPPRSYREVVRDFILRTLDHPIAQCIGLFVVLLIVADGGLFFFSAIGAHRLCRPRLNCEPRNTVVNISIHVLNGGISYMSAASFPWRWANFVHLLGCTPRSCAVGQNLYGQPCAAHDVWFHIPRQKRLGITILLLFQCFLQLTNHIMRGIYWSYELSQAMPGAVLTKVFMVASFSCSGAAAAWTAVESRRLRKAFPKQFSVGQLTLWSKPPSTSSNEAQMVETDDGSVNDSTRERRHRALLLSNDRGSMRMFAM